MRIETRDGKSCVQRKGKNVCRETRDGESCV